MAAVSAKPISAAKRAAHFFVKRFAFRAKKNVVCAKSLAFYFDFAIMELNYMVFAY